MVHRDHPAVSGRTRDNPNLHTVVEEARNDRRTLRTDPDPGRRHRPDQPEGQRRARRVRDQPRHRVHRIGAQGTRPDRSPADRGDDARRPAATRLRPVQRAVEQPAEVGVPGESPRPERGAVLPAAVRAPVRDAARRLHADGRPGHRAVQPRVPPHPGRLPLGGPPGGRRDRAAQHRSRPGRRRPAGGDGLRGHPRHRRPGHRRHRDLGRQARRLHGSRRHPPAPRAPRRAGHGHRQPEAAQRRHVPRHPARPRAGPAVRRPDRRLRRGLRASCSRTRCCTGRTSVRATPGGS